MKAKPIKDLFIKDLKDAMRFYNLNNDFAALYGSDKTAEDLIKRMEMLAIMYKDADFKRELKSNFPTYVQSANLDVNQQVPQQIFR